MSRCKVTFPNPPNMGGFFDALVSERNYGPILDLSFAARTITRQLWRPGTRVVGTTPCSGSAPRLEARFASIYSGDDYCTGPLSFSWDLSKWRFELSIRLCKWFGQNLVKPGHCPGEAMFKLGHPVERFLFCLFRGGSSPLKSTTKQKGCPWGP